MPIISQPNFIIRSMNYYDNDEVLELCRRCEIVIGEQVNLTMMKIDHNCLQIAEDIDNGMMSGVPPGEGAGKVVGVCSGFNLNQNAAAFGEYAIETRYRRFGIGCALWKRCIEHCSNRANCAILANAKNVAKYREKSGFAVIPARKLVQFSGFPQLFMLNKYHEGCDFEWINEFNLADVIAYDEQVCGFNRGRFIEYSLSESSSIATLARCVQSGKILGYGIFRRTSIRSTIIPQPLYATSQEIAEVLLYNALQMMTGWDRVTMECWDINQDAIELASDKMGLIKQKLSTVMFTERDVGANFKNIFCNSPSAFYPF